jgi:hypothetical protein
MTESEGWGFFEPAKVEVPEEQPKQDIDLILARTFASQEGQQALAWLRQATIEVPAWVPGQEASYGYAREGQNSLVREIERRIARAKL